MKRADGTVVVRVGGEGGEGTITLGDIFHPHCSARWTGNLQLPHLSLLRSKVDR